MTRRKRERVAPAPPSPAPEPPPPPPPSPPPPTPPAERRGELPPWFRRGVLFVLVVITGLQVAVWAFGELRSYLGLVIVAWLLSISIEPVVAGLNRRGVRRGLATGVVMLSAAALLAGFVALFGAVLVDQLTRLISALPDLVDDVVAWTNQTLGTELQPRDISDSLGLTPERTGDLAQELAPGLAGLVSSFFNLVLQALALTLLVFYMSAEGPQLRRTVASWFPPRQQAVIVTAWEISTEKAGRYVVSKTVLAVLSTAFTGAFLWLLDVPFWLPLALWTGLVSQFVPTVGTYIAIAVPALVALAADPADGLWVLLFGIVYQQVENYGFSPRITARTMSVHPAVGFSAAIAGAALFGPLGALFSVPVVATLVALAQTYGQRYELVDALRDDARPPSRPGRAPSALRPPVT